MTMQKKIILCTVGLVVIIIIGGWATYLNTMANLPDINRLDSCFTTSMNKVYLCQTSTNYSKLDEISSYIKDAILVSEDVSFYQHNGFDTYEIRESFFTNLLRLRFARGGSTVTQQLAKNIYLNPNKSLLRKLKEALITIKLEKNYTKDLIFEKYLNVVQLGKDIYGVKMASQHYFDKLPSELSVNEAAFLAYLLPSPIKYSQVITKGQHTDFSRARIADIVYKMHFFKRISELEYESARLQLSEMP